MRRATFYLQLFCVGLSLILFCDIAIAQVADHSPNQAQQPGAGPTSACESLRQKDFPKDTKSSLWRGRATSKDHVWNCIANERRNYEEMWFQIGLSVAGDRIAGGLECDVSSGPIKEPDGRTYETYGGRSGVITSGRVNGDHYSFRVVFCDDYAESCELRGRKMADILIAGRYVCRRAGKQLNSGIWTVELYNPTPRPQPPVPFENRYRP